MHTNTRDLYTYWVEETRASFFIGFCCCSLCVGLSPLVVWLPSYSVCSHDATATASPTRNIDYACIHDCCSTIPPNALSLTATHSTPNGTVATSSNILLFASTRSMCCGVTALAPNTRMFKWGFLRTHPVSCHPFFVLSVPFK